MKGVLIVSWSEYHKSKDTALYENILSENTSEVYPCKSTGCVRSPYFYADMK